VFTDIHYIFLANDAYNICRDCFQCSLTLSVTCSVAAAVKRYNAFCVQLTANSDTEQNNIS